MKHMGRHPPAPSLPRAGRLSRRRLVQAGGLGLVGLSLPDLLFHRSPAAAQGLSAGTGRAPRAEACIFVVQYGGASHIDTWDLKPAAPAEIRGPYQPIATRTPGVQVGELLPLLAEQSEQWSLVRSMTHGTADHDGGMHVCMTGHARPVADTPYFGSIVARMRPATANLPSYVWIQNLDRDVQPRYLEGGWLGANYAPLRVATNEDNPSAEGFRVAAFDPQEGTSVERLADRLALLDRLESASSSRRDAPAAQAMHDCQVRAADLLTGTRARQAFDLARESDGLRDRYGRHPLGQNLLLARRLVEAGVRLVTVNAWLGVAPGEKFLVTQGWDHHGAAVQGCGIFSTGSFGLGFALPRFDQALSALLADLAQRGLLDSTLVVVAGEFGRTPQIASNPYPGRDHWPHCYSALLAGGRARGGAAYGASDKTGAYVANRPVTPADFHATLFQALGIPPETRFGPDGFSLRVSDGQPIDELFT
jgi:hypothetical protein